VLIKITKQTFKNFIKLLIPPVVLYVFNKVKIKKYGWQGEYKSWIDAKNAATGYDTSTILQRVKESSLKVKNGEAIYERDSIIYDKIYYSWQLLAVLLLCATKDRKLNVVDFGGSLGSTYFQNKKFLDELHDVNWNIIEQKKFVDVGREEFEDERLHFYYDLETCIKKTKSDIILLSSVLQYVEKPYTLLDDIFKYNFEYIVIDRTLFSLDNKDHIKLQIVPPIIYEASYPSWLFSEESLIEHFLSNNYILLEKFNSECSQYTNKNNIYELKGMIWKKNLE